MKGYSRIKRIFLKPAREGADIKEKKVNKFTKQCVAAVASLAMAGTLCVAGAVVANSSAWATPKNVPQQQKAKPAPWSDEGKKLKGKITIKKQDASNNNAALPGAVFTIQKVTNIKTGDNDTKGLDVDLTSVDGWTKLAEKVNQLNTTPLDETKLSLSTVTDDTTKTTDSNGKAEFDNLDLGLYLVKEKSAPTGYTTDVKPFFMTVPEITRAKDSTNNTYTYEVSVEPKNTNVKNNVTKTAETEKIVGAGDTLTYTISAKVNKKKSDASATTGITKDELQGFAIYDDAVTAAYDSVANDVVKEVKIHGESSAMASTDYTVDSTALTAPEDATRTRIKVTFNNSGLEKIATAVNTANSTNDVSIDVTLNLKLKADLSAFAGSDNKLTNKSGFIPGHTAGVPDTPTTGGEVSNEFRKFHIFKYDGVKGKDDANAKLKDAKFKVFAGATGDTTTDAAALKVAQKCADDPTAANACDAALKGFEDSTKTYNKTDNNGVTEDYTAKVGQKFYIVETAAPDGYTRSTKVYSVTLESAPQKTNNQDTPAQVVPIANIPDNRKDGGMNWFKLPKTGAAGVIIFALAGVCLVCFGIFIFMRNRKKEEEQQNA